MCRRVPSHVLPCRVAVIGLATLTCFLPHSARAIPTPIDGVSATALDFDASRRIDVNSLEMAVTNIAVLGWTAGFPGSEPSGLIFPRGSGHSVAYSAGLWIGALVQGQARVTVSGYGSEYRPGRILDDGTWVDPALDRLHVYKIVRGDTAGADYATWPAGDGAPVDRDGRPKSSGDQTLWCVYNDADPSAHTGWGGRSAPLGVEVRQKVYAVSGREPEGHAIYAGFRIRNRGQQTLMNAYVGMWCDADIGGPQDDLAGCDSVRQFGYAYNGTNADQVYGSRPPALGIALYQGPIVPSPGDTAHVGGVAYPGYRNLPMTSFWAITQYGDPQRAQDSYWALQGRAPDGSPYWNPATRKQTAFVYSGDPVAVTGWLDSGPADRRILVSTGPFDVAPGDSQDVVFAFLVAQGSNRLDSVRKLQEWVPAAGGLVPVLLTGGSAQRESDTVVLSWNVSADAANAPFLVYRQVEGEEPELISPNPLSGATEYRFVDPDPPVGPVRYWIVSLEPDGSGSWFGPYPVGRAVNGPARDGLLTLSGANPAAGPFTIRYGVAAGGSLRLTIHDERGSLVRLLFDGVAGPGEWAALWDARDGEGRASPAGIYHARLDAGGAIRSLKLTVVR